MPLLQECLDSCQGQTGDDFAERGDVKDSFWQKAACRARKLLGQGHMVQRAGVKHSSQGCASALYVPAKRQDVSACGRDDL